MLLSLSAYKRIAKPAAAAPNPNAISRALAAPVKADAVALEVDDLVAEVFVVMEALDPPKVYDASEVETAALVVEPQASELALGFAVGTELPQSEPVGLTYDAESVQVADPSSELHELWTLITSPVVVGALYAGYCNTVGDEVGALSSVGDGP